MDLGVICDKNRRVSRRCNPVTVESQAVGGATHSPATVTRATLPVIVRAGGEIESSRTIDVICEVEGQQIKIIEMLPEGTRVTAGQVVLRFDAAEFNRSLSEAKVKLMKAESLAKAETEHLITNQELTASTSERHSERSEESARSPDPSIRSA